MTTRTAATYVEQPIVGHDLANAAARCADLAADRLGGAGQLVAMNTKGEPGSLVLCSTWRREWDEIEPAPPTPPEPEPETDGAE